ncbi:ComF family protein [Ornithinimicrobium faecis]|uniref:ComF family protein n=1 Tax=Ornithinimicrobium faecis TaxID=2934158 RepID=A0ABY4YRD3_9MICO|nr:phosphoribosyltransferase family protein [Ornithinimicrobium sp. HY1793]USQ78717.1 ComF family protein [Ornithinimicrobium sp. HY1793]
MRPGRRAAWLAEGAAALGDLVLPVACGGCGSPGAPWCPGCRAVVSAAPGPQRWTPTPAPPGLPPVWTVLPYVGPVRAGLVNWKDNGRRDLAEVLAPVLAEGLLRALLTCDSVPVVVPAPSGRANTRRRGDHPLAGLARAALRRLPPDSRPALVPALRLARTVADQAGLDSRHRAANLAGAMVVPTPAARRVRGVSCLLVDDVITTGATIVEAARALRAAGVRDVVAVTLAATHRRTHPALSFTREPG